MSQLKVSMSLVSVAVGWSLSHGTGWQKSRERNDFGSGKFSVITGIVTLNQNRVALPNDIAPG